MKYLIYNFLTIICLFSCKSKTTQQIEKDIVGEWSFVKTQNFKKNNEIVDLISYTYGRNINGYIFYDDNRCENKLGYFKKKGGDRKIIFLGYNTRYKVKDNELKIFDLSDSLWKINNIKSLKGDTLTFQINDSLITKYVRILYKLNPKETYDKIIVSSSGCYGTCPIMNISLDKNGEVLFLGERYNTKNGFFSSKISNEEFQSIQNDFKKADIPDLKNSYVANWTDDQTITITFIKNNQIVKSISDYGNQSPKELIWAYDRIRYLYQMINLTPIKNNISELYFSTFEDGRQICRLSKSERFYLYNEILKGKIVNSKFQSKYKMKSWDENDKTSRILTDGQYFKIKDKTIDLGYNFIKVNDLNKKFEVKTKYDRYF